MIPPDCTHGLARAGLMVDDCFEPGFLCYDVPVGTDKYVEHMLSEKMLEIAKSAQKSAEVLDEEHQSL